MLNPDPDGTPGEESRLGEHSNIATSHAPGLLEGPDLNKDSKLKTPQGSVHAYFIDTQFLTLFLCVAVPDISLIGVDDSADFLKPLLSALGMSQPRPTPQKFEFSEDDPMGGEFLKVTDEDGTKQDQGSKQVLGGGSVQRFRMSSVCEDLMGQVPKLDSMEETLYALHRVTLGAQVLVARHVTLMLIASLSTEQSGRLSAVLKSLGLLDVKFLVQLLRLVDAGRVDSAPGESYVVTIPSTISPVPAVQCLSDALASVITSENATAGLQLMQSCCRDLFTAAVGGAELVQESGRKWHRRLGPHAHFHRNEVSDLSVLGTPNLKVSQKLVKILARSAAKLVGSDLLIGGVVLMMDALAACLFSFKLDPEHRLWAMQHLVRIFAVTGAAEVMKKATSQKQKKGVLFIR